MRSAPAVALLAAVLAAPAVPAAAHAADHRRTAPAAAAEAATVVGTAEELADALADAGPGDVIELRPGRYTGTFDATASGTAERPITLTGPRGAVLSNDDGYGLHLDGADHWNLAGFAVADSSKGIVLDEADHVVIDGVEVYGTAAEAVHLRAASSDNTVRNSAIHDTGLEQPQYGEGVYIGSAVNHWDDFGENGGTGPDRSDRNQVVGNTIGPGVTAEHVDVKEGTRGGVVRGNTFDGDGISGQNSADSWMDVKGNGYLIASNTGTFGGDGVLTDGYQTHDRVAGYGCGNTFRANDSDLGGADGYAVNITNQGDCPDAPNVVTSDNTVTGAGRGLTNIPTTDPAPGRDGALSQGRTLSLRTLPDSRTGAAEYVECTWDHDGRVSWWWNASYSLTRVDTGAEGHVECDADIYGIESQLFVRHDGTRIAVDEHTCVSGDDGDECASSDTAGAHSCTAGTWCAGTWTTGHGLRLQLEDGSWDPDTFPAYCSVEGAEDEIARCYREGSNPIQVPPAFPPAG